MCGIFLAFKPNPSRAASSGNAARFRFRTLFYVPPSFSLPPLCLDALMLLHIASGLCCLVIGPFLMIIKPKGGIIHKRWGRVFLRLLSVLGVTAGLLLLVRPNPFFFSLSVLSFYFAFSGWRVLNWHKTGIVSWTDYATAFSTIATGIAGVVGSRNGVFGRDAAIVLGTLGFAVAAAVYDLWRIRTGAHGPLARFWIVEHLTKMSGASLAVASAFSGTVLTALPVAIAQTWPAVLGVPILLLVANRYYRRALL